MYLGGLNKPGRGSWGTCSDVEVLVFLEAHYLHNMMAHTVATLRPALWRGRSVRSCALALCCTVSGHGVRTLRWGCPHGNPCESIDNADFQTAYSNVAQLRAGQYEVSATPMAL